MRPKANCNISKVYKERRKRGGGKKTQRQQQGEIDTTTNLPSPSASLSLSLFLSHSLSATCSNSPTRLPPLSITASFPTVMSAPGAGREQGRGEVLQGIRVFKIYTLAFLLWVISANSPPPPSCTYAHYYQQVVNQCTTPLHTVHRLIPSITVNIINNRKEACLSDTIFKGLYHCVALHYCLGYTVLLSLAL